jgi:probable rRNA maturation factor
VPRRSTNVVDVSIAHPRGAPFRRRLTAWGRGYLEKLELEGCELSISLVTDAAIHRLNRTWRKKDRPTDVLSFPADAPPAGAPGPRPLGDVVVSLDTARRVAREEGRSVDAELARYLAHGLLHLLGHDHERPSDARRMAALEEQLLGERGLIPPRRAAR